MKQKYHVILSESEREYLKKYRYMSKNSMESKKRAGVLLELDEGNGRTAAGAKEIAGRHGVSEESVRTYRRRCAIQGMEGALLRKERAEPAIISKVTGEVEAHIIAVSCSAAPEGKSQWTLKMIADKIVMDGVIDNISDETVRRVLKKRHLSLIKKRNGV